LLKTPLKINTKAQSIISNKIQKLEYALGMKRLGTPDLTCEVVNIASDTGIACSKI